VRRAADVAFLLIWAAPVWAQTHGATEPLEAMERARHAYELARAGELEPAVAELEQAARIAPGNPLYRSALGGMYERGGKLEEAVAAFADAVRLDPANPTLNAHLESVSLDWGAELAGSRHFRAGLVHARVTAERFPKSARAYLMLGLFQARNQQNLAAVASYRRAVELDPQSADASVGLGVAQSSAGLVKDAEATFEAGLKKFPDNAKHRQAYGVLLARMAESGEAPAGRAVAMLESALALDPLLAEAHYQLGSLALASNGAAAAVLHFEAAARNGLDDSRLHYATARALRRLGKADESARHMELFRKRKQSEESPGV
jgi:tetratricopeptide (TPR) repeat protein